MACSHSIMRCDDRNRVFCEDCSAPMEQVIKDDLARKKAFIGPPRRPFKFTPPTPEQERLRRFQFWTYLNRSAPSLAEIMESNNKNFSF